MVNVDLPPSSELDHVPRRLLEIMRDMRQAIETEFSVNARDASFARLGVLMYIDATPGSVRGHIRHLLDLGVTPNEIWAVLYSIIGHIGMPKFVAMLPVMEAEIGLPTWEEPA